MADLYAELGLGPEDNLGVQRPLPKPSIPEPRIAVVGPPGPNGQPLRGTIPASSVKNLPEGWSIKPISIPGADIIGPEQPGLQRAQATDVDVFGAGGMDPFDTGLKKAYTFEPPGGGLPKTIYPPPLNERGENPLAEQVRDVGEFIVGGVGGFGAGKALKGAAQKPFIKRAVKSAREALDVPDLEAGFKVSRGASESLAKTAEGAARNVEAVKSKSKEALEDTMRAVEKRILAGRKGATSVDMGMFEEPVEQAMKTAAQASGKAERVAKATAGHKEKMMEASRSAKEMANKSLSVGQAAKDITPAAGTIAGGAAGHAIWPGYGAYIGANVGGRAAARAVGTAPKMSSSTLGQIAEGFISPYRNIEQAIESPALWYNLARLLPYLGAGGGILTSTDEQQQPEDFEEELLYTPAPGRR